MAEMIERPEYLRQLERFRDSDSVKVLQGVRRCGKSTILRLYRNRLVASGVPETHIYYQCFDEFGLPQTVTVRELTERIARFLKGMAPANDGNAMRYVFLDEIQEVDGWEKVVRGLQAMDGVDVYVTGSNARLLSSDLASLLSGRTVSIPVWPLSFREYESFTQMMRPNVTGAQADSASRDELFACYLSGGRKTSAATNYCTALEQACIMVKVGEAGVIGKKLLTPLRHTEAPKTPIHRAWRRTADANRPSVRPGERTERRLRPHGRAVSAFGAS